MKNDIDKLGAEIERIQSQMPSLKALEDLFNHPEITALFDNLERDFAQLALAMNNPDGSIVTDEQRYQFVMSRQVVLKMREVLSQSDGAVKDREARVQTLREKQDKLENQPT